MLMKYKDMYGRPQKCGAAGIIIIRDLDQELIWSCKYLSTQQSAPISS